MLFLTILPGGLYGGSKDLPVASTNNAEPQKDIVSTDISSLMDSMNIQRLPKPESSPDFNLMSVAEEQFRLSEQRGRVVLLSFWATWWGWCKKEFPSLENLHQNFKEQSFSLLAIDVGETKETVLAFVEDNNLSFTFLLDEDKQVSARYGVRSHPMNFLINKKGDLIGVSRGYREWDTEEMKKLISLLLSP